MYAVFVVLPLLQKEFGVTRAEASIPWLLTTLGFGFGGIIVGRIADRRGVFLPELSGVLFLAGGFVAAAQAQSLWQFALIQGVAIAMLGSAASFAPLIGDISHWFSKRRGMAMSICVSGNLAAGAVWPPILQYFFDRVGWRATFVGTGIACLVLMLPLVLMLRKKSPVGESVRYASGGSLDERPLGFSPPVFQAILAFAGFCCCLAMAVPQVHIVAYCGDLGYGALRGAQMLSLMLGAGIMSRLLMGWMSDTIGGLRTLLLGSVLQCASLAFFVPFDSVGSLYVLSMLFGFFGGGIVPAYTLIVREYFSPAQAGARIGIILMTALLGMGLGGWIGGWFFDATGSYQSAFVFGVGANLVNIGLVLWLMARAGIHLGVDIQHALGTKRAAKA